MSQELDELPRPVSDRLLEPARDERVHGPALAAWERLVGDLSRQDVLEDVLGFSRDRRSQSGEDELAVLEGTQRVVDRGAVIE